MQKLTINVDEPDDLLSGYGAGALLRVERDTTAAFTAPVEVTTIALVATTRQYEYWDVNGASGDYYRTRYSTATPSVSTDYSDYSDVFQAGQINVYATLDDVTETMSVASSDTAKLNLLADLLVDATDQITRMCGRSFFRSPQISGTETRLYHVRNLRERSLVRAVGRGLDIVPGSITSVEIADQTGGTYTTVAAGSTGYWTDPQNPDAGFPIEDIVLSRIGATYLVYPYGDQIVRITAAFGWAAVPALVKRATVDLAREWFRQGPGGGGPIGIGALGQPIFGSGMPPTVLQLYRSDYRKRSFSYV